MNLTFYGTRATAVTPGKKPPPTLLSIPAKPETLTQGFWGTKGCYYHQRTGLCEKFLIFNLILISPIQKQILSLQKTTK